MTVKISNLPAATSVGSGDVLPVVQSGTTKKIDLNSPWSINIDGGNIDGTPIGVSSASSGAFTTLTASDDVNFDSGTLFVDASTNNVGIGTTSPASLLEISGENNVDVYLPAIRVANRLNYGWGVGIDFAQPAVNNGPVITTGAIYNDYDSDNNYSTRFSTMGSGTLAERMRIDSSGNVGIGTTAPSQKLDVNGRINGTGIRCGNVTLSLGSNSGFGQNFGVALEINRGIDDGAVMWIKGDGTIEGSISISGTTVSYNGGHLARWSQLLDNTKDESIVKGTVMTNLDEMAEWVHEDGTTEDNEQLNRMKVSDVEGDPNVAGVFVNWDEDDDQFTADMNIAMTGDMVIRIAQGVTVQRGDLLMSAGDGTAKPQGDDIVKSKTIAKVTSTHVSHTYDDGSYLVPCVLMAC